MIKVDKINKYFNGNHVLKDVSIEISKGEVVAIIGKSGAGKSTLLRCINMLDPPDSGTIFIDNICVGNKNIIKIRQKIGFVFQSYNLFDHLTVMDNITIAPIKILGVSKKTAQEKARELLAMVGLEDKANAIPSELSGGQKQRIAIARALAMSPDAILFDEPTSALDPIITNEILTIIRNLTQNGMTVVIVTHEMNFANAIANSVVYMDNGEIVEHGEPKQIFHAPRDSRTKTFIELSSEFHLIG